MHTEQVGTHACTDAAFGSVFREEHEIEMMGVG